MQISNFFPNYLYDLLKNYIVKYENELEEIRIRVNKPIILKISSSDIILEYIVNSNDMIEILQRICENSIYSYQNQICNGYITILGGHRVGITGNVIMDNGKIVNMNNISSLNFRISRQILNCSNFIIKEIINNDENSIYNTLIVSPPGAGKTTVLRDSIRQLSNGIGTLNGYTIGVVDERGEIAAMYKGVPQNDIGIRTDVIENVPKALGLKMLIRSMGPQIVCADEIGGQEDLEVINYAVCSGVKGIFTAHGANYEEIKINPYINKMLDLHIFKRIIFLDKNEKGKISNVVRLD